MKTCFLKLLKKFGRPGRSLRDLVPLVPGGRNRGVPTPPPPGREEPAPDRDPQGTRGRGPLGSRAREGAGGDASPRPALGPGSLFKTRKPAAASRLFM